MMSTSSEDRASGTSTRTIGIAAVLAVLLAGCRTTMSLGPGASGGIGDDACAVMLTIEAVVIDQDGQPVAGAEVWELDRVQPRKALRIGVTNAEGRLDALDCTMGTSEFRVWHPDETIPLSLMVIGESFGVARLRLSLPVKAVLATGSLLRVQPGEPIDYNAFMADAMTRSFRVPLHVTLRR